MKRLLLPLLLLLVADPALAAKKGKGKKAAPPPAAEPAPPPVDPEAWRATAPGPTAARPWAPPAAKVITLSNGIPVYLVESTGLPLVSVRLVMNVGREANPKGKAGLASFTANLLDEGTKTRTADQIASTAAALGAELSVSGGDEAAVVSLDALTGEALGPSLDLMADVVRNPKFDKAAVERVRKEILAEIQDEKSEPRLVVNRVTLRELWGADHPYGTPAIGDEASLKAIAGTDVTRFYQTWWHAKNAAFVVAGAVDEAQVKEMLEARFGSWKPGTATRSAVAAPSVPMKARVVFVEQPGAVQSVLRVVTPGPSRTSPEYHAANVAGTIVGGMFSSRINMNLREEKGWSYGAFGGFSESRDFGTFAVRTQVQADKTGAAVAEIMKELVAAASAPPTPQLLTMAKDSIGKALPGNFETNATTAASFVQVPRFGLGADAWQGYLKDLEAVDGGRATEMARKYFDPNRFLVVVVGPKSVEVDDGKGGKTTVDVVKGLQDLGYELVVR